MIALATLGLKYHYRLANMFGRNNWFERKLGGGSTHTITVLGMILLIFVGMTTMFGLGDDLAYWLTTPLRTAFNAGR